MSFRFSFILLFFIFCDGVLFAQKEKNFTIEFSPSLGNSALRLESFYKLNEKDSIQIETLKFYVSGIELTNNEKVVWKAENSFHLVDASNEKSLKVSFKMPSEITYNKIKFNLGIDSSTNVSGAMEGDLDPTKGMYWTWQSGYVNFKLEGKSNLCKTRNNAFTFHLGGYQFPGNALQKVILETEVRERIIVSVDVKKFISAIDLSKENEIMTPGKEAVLLSEKATKIFTAVK